MRPAHAVVVFFLIASLCLAADKKEEQQTKPADSIHELQQQIEKILKDTHTPGASVAIVHKNGPEWVTGLGVADVASKRPVTVDTLFRIGSTSKAFASLSILLLTDQGKLSLQDSVHQLASDVWFNNPWEATDPVRVVNLLEHTTGWDDIHLREYAKEAPDSMTLKEGLDYDHHSRTSRWRPGTRMAYCNSGPPVAAYIVEKITGQRFEDFVEQNLFAPIGMKTTTYFQPPAGSATTLYHDDGKTPYPYWHILLRPAGAINASANDMAAYVQFYLNRGAVNGKQVVTSADIDRMESPTSTWAAKDGMKAGYGLSNYWSVEEGFVYHGHDGGVEGGLTDMSYMPDYGVGYFFSINSGNGTAYENIGKAIRAYLTKGLEKPALPVASLPADATDYAGWYEPNSPRVELTHFLGRLLGLSWIQFRDGKLFMTRLGARDDEYLPVTGGQFRHVPKKDPPSPVATFALLSVNPEGRFVQDSLGTTMKQIPGWFAISEIVLAAFVLLSVIAIVIYAPFWILGGLSRRRRRPAERAMRLWPLIAVLSLIAFVVIFMLSSDDLIERMGNLTLWSFALFAMTLVFASAVLASLISVWRAGTEARRGVRRFSIVVTIALVIAAAYLAEFGIIGLRTWA
ncbi:MAG TPA: serine hydrolase domain-containing protein [Candidatus Sulfotelmatobacter sp.]|nr:serine hydrolase domain-containing protein [Candidatus Sulfotelmatobacter sp.]